jgi:Gpi18-like mannosyltransferase
MPRILRSRLLPPAAAYLVVRLAYAAATGTSPWAFDAATFSRWDSGNYAEIAQVGYRWASCAAQNRPQHGDVCSTAAWYPAYPFLSRALSALGPDLDTALVVVAHLAFVGLLVAVWTGLLEGPGSRPLLLLALVAFFPGGAYLLGAFPLSLLVLLLALQVAAFTRSRWGPGAAAGAAASLCYPITAVLAPAAALWALLAGGARRWVRAAAVGAVVLAGTVAVFALHQVVLGSWSASLEEQRRFGGSLYNPLLNWVHTVVLRNSWIQLDRPATAWPIAAQTVVVTAFVVLCAVEVWRHRTDGEAWRDLGLLVWVVALWLFPLASSIETGLYRRVLPLAPGVWLLRRAPVPVVAALTAGSLAVWWWMAPLFASGDLL